MTTKANLDQGWFRAMVSRYSRTVAADLTDKARAEEVLETFLFLPMEQQGQLIDMLRNLP